MSTAIMLSTACVLAASGVAFISWALQRHREIRKSEKWLEARQDGEVSPFDRMAIERKCARFGNLLESDDEISEFIEGRRSM